MAPLPCWMAAMAIVLAASAHNAVSSSGAELDPRSKQFYDNYHARRDGLRCSACTFIGSHMSHFPGTRTVLDAGAGNCLFTRWLLDHGYAPKGIELSTVALEKHCSDLLANGTVQQGSLAELPFPDNHFDLVMSFEVLEHVPPELTGKIISELVRVSTGRLFLTISLRLSAHDKRFMRNPRVHINVRARSDWDQLFMAAGCEVESEFLAGIQQRAREENVAHHNRNFGRRRARLSPVQGGELEPWFFVYKCKKMCTQ